MSETGVIKFTCEHVRVALQKFDGLDALNECRRQLLARGWIGVDENGIGFGNLSVRDGDAAQFFITGSGTGAKSDLTPTDYAHVIDWDFDRNWLRCEGPIVASSESLTHAAVYTSCGEARAVIHIHSVRLWQMAQGQVPSTSETIEYGTPAMAYEIRRLIAETRRAEQPQQLFRMAGHRGGLIAFGSDPCDALNVLTSFNQKLRDFPATPE